MSQRGRLQRITMLSRSDLRRAEVSLRSSEGAASGGCPAGSGV